MANNYRRNKRRKKKRTIMRSLTIQEMSGVDVPAQEGATALIMKRAEKSPAQDAESFINMVQAGDWDNVCKSMTSDDGLAAVSSAFEHVTLQAGYVAPEVGNLISNGITYKFAAAPEEELIEKLVMLTSEEDNHQHAIRLDRFDLEEGGGSTSFQGGTPDSEHWHDYVINADGSITIGESQGHTHEVDMSILARLQLIFSEKNSGDPSDKSATDSGDPKTVEKSDMDEEQVQAMIEAALTKQAETHQTELDAANARASLTDIQKSFCDGLGEDEQASFMKLSSEQRQSAVDTDIAKRNDADPVVYTSAAGTEYHKSDGPRLIDLAKRDDAREIEMKALRESSETASLEKRAGELEHLPGTPEQKIAMLKAIDSIEDEELRKQSLENLSAQNVQMSKAFDTAGVRPGDAAITKGPEAELQTLAKAYAVEHKVTEADAYVKVLETPEGDRLYAASVH